jgi:hypothetical protein
MKKFFSNIWTIIKNFFLGIKLLKLDTVKKYCTNLTCYSQVISAWNDIDKNKDNVIELKELTCISKAQRKAIWSCVKAGLKLEGKKITQDLITVAGSIKL